MYTGCVASVRLFGLWFVDYLIASLWFTSLGIVVLFVVFVVLIVAIYCLLVINS